MRYVLTSLCFRCLFDVCQTNVEAIEKSGTDIKLTSLSLRIQTLKSASILPRCIRIDIQSLTFAMKLNTLNVLAFAASASAVSEQLIKNFCTEDIYVTLFLNSTDSTDGPFVLPSGQAWVNDIEGTGNTATITKSANVFQAVPKLILGTSTDKGILYW